MQAGTFMQIKPFHPLILEKDLSLIFSRMLSFSENQHEDINLKSNEREMLLDKLVEYYSIHHEGVKNINSVGVLKDVLH